MSIWPFKKKVPSKRRIVVLNPKLGAGSIIPVTKEELFNSTISQCPEVHVHAHTCVCVTCPQRVKGCYLETVFRTAGCRMTFLTSCSYKKSILGLLDGKEKENGEKEDLGLTGIIHLSSRECGECGECNGACASSGERVLSG